MREKLKTGRKLKGFTAAIPVRVTPEDRAKLYKYAEAIHQPASDVVRAILIPAIAELDVEKAVHEDSQQRIDFDELKKSA